jgi:hypothetical protein
VLTTQTEAMGVSAEREANWPRLAATAALAVEEGREAVRAVRFRTDAGASRLNPVAGRTPVTVNDGEADRLHQEKDRLGPGRRPTGLATNRHHAPFWKAENPRMTGGFRWRYRWDLNPRWSCPHTCFRDMLLRPLGHGTGIEFT